MSFKKTIRLTWGDPNSGANQEDEIRVYRSATPLVVASLPAPIATLQPDSAMYDDENPGDGDFYYGVGMVSGSTVELTELTVDAGIDPSTYDPAPIVANGEFGWRFNAANTATVWQDAASTIPAGSGDSIGSMTDSLGGATKLTLTNCTLETDGTYWWVDPGASGRAVITNSRVTHQFMHDGSGGEFIAAVRFDTPEGAAQVLIDNCNLQTGRTGFSLFGDRRVALPRHNQLQFLVPNGGAASTAPIAAAVNDFMTPGQDQVVGCLFQTDTGNDGCITSGGSRIYGGKKASGGLGQASHDLRFFQRASSGDFQMVGRLYDCMMVNRPLIEAEHVATRRLFETQMPNDANQVSLFSFTTAARTEWFVDQSNIDTSTGINFNITRPQKYVNGPVSSVAGISTATWDFDGYYATVLYEGAAGYKCWMGCFDDAGAHAGISYMTSDDGKAWVKPDLGVITYGGNTNNNLINTGYDPTVVNDGAQYVMLQGVPDGAGGVEQQSGDIKTSIDGITSWTLQATFNPASYAEFHGMTLRNDGRYLVYYTFGHGGDARKIGAYLSDTTSLSGSWTDEGLIINIYEPSQNEQIYNFCATPLHGVLYGIACRFDDFTERIYIDLHTSIDGDGLTWTARNGGFIPMGKFGEYDGGMVIGKQITDDGNELRFWYTASNGAHNGSLPRDSRLAYASVPSGRLGRLMGAGGTVITTALTLTDELYVNSISAGGSLSVEVLDAFDDSVLAGYAKADCDTLDGDHAALEITWGGLSAPTGQSVKLKFYLDA